MPASCTNDYAKFMFFVKIIYEIRKIGIIFAFAIGRIKITGK